MKTVIRISLFACALGILNTGCKKDPEKPMTDKEFEKAVKRNFAGDWEEDMFDNSHKSLNAKSHALAGKIEPVLTFTDNGSYHINYDSLINGNSFTICESGTWSIDYSARSLYLYPAKVTMKDGNNNESNLAARPSYHYGIRFLTSEHLYLENYYITITTSTNSEGVQVEQTQHSTETIYFTPDKKC